MKLHFRLLRALFPKYAAKHKGFLPGLKNCFMCPPPPCAAAIPYRIFYTTFCTRAFWHWASGHLPSAARCRSYTIPCILHYFLHPCRTLRFTIILALWPPAAVCRKCTVPCISHCFLQPCCTVPYVLQVFWGFAEHRCVHALARCPALQPQSLIEIGIDSQSRMMMPPAQKRKWSESEKEVLLSQREPFGEHYCLD